jgi:hypothetical protein
MASVRLGGFSDADVDGELWLSKLRIHIKSTKQCLEENCDSKVHPKIRA